MSQAVVCPVVVGRDEELSRLEDALLDAARRDSRFVVVVGEAGIGKSRIAAETETRAERLGFTVMRGACSEAELALPYLPLIEALGNYIASQDTQTLARRLGGARIELARLFPQLAIGEAPPPGGDPGQAKLRLFESVVAMVSLAAADAGLLLVVEDIHWADASTRELLDYLSRRLRGLRAMVLMTYRSDELHRKHPLVPTIQSWRRSGLAEVIELKEMSELDVAEMMSCILDTAEITVDFRDNMHQRSEGNPFVLEELLKHAIDRGEIVRTASQWRHEALDQVPLPDSVKDTILFRIERFGDTEARVLQAAAVLGYVFSYSTLTAVANTPESEVQAAIASAMQNQLVIEAGRPGRYRFRHALTQEAIYEDTVLPRRQEIHSRAADILAEDPTTNPIELALHFLGAARFKEAVPACLDAAANAEHTHAHSEAVKLYERALPHVSNDRDRAEVLCRMGSSLNIDGRPSTAAQCLEEGIALLEEIGDLQAAARYHLVLGRARWELSRPDQAAEQYDQALQELERQGPSSDLALAYMRIAGLHLFQLEIEPSLDAARKAVTTAEAVGDDVNRIWALGFLALALLDSGDVEAGLATIERSHREAMEHGVPHIAINAAYNDLWNRVHCMIPGAKAAFERLEQSSDWSEWGRAAVLLTNMYLMRIHGRIETWVDVGTRSVERFERLSNDKYIWRSSLLLAEGLLEGGDVEGALRYLPDISTRVELQDVLYDSSARIRTYIAAGETERLRVAALSILDAAPKFWTYRPTLALGVEAFVHVGDIDNARKLVEVARSKPYPAGDAALEQAEGRVFLAIGDSESAVDSLARAVEGYREAGYVLDELRTLILLAAAQSENGDRDLAGQTLREATEHARELGALQIVHEALDTARGHDIRVDLATRTSLDDAEIATGERLVTVLFADVRGYTELTSQRTPDEMVEMVASLQRWATREVERHSGLIDKFAGDAVMATFNVSGETVDHCRQALEAAIALRDKAALTGIPLGIGLAVGPAIVGRLVPNSNLSVIGETTNLAARLQHAAAAGEIVLSEEAYRRVRDWLASRSIVVQELELSLKGFPEPVRVFRIRTLQPAG
ncbi:MAG TPA: AAA family ATPase [Actinomycetota bacterium]|nr:AAA family ATPase [Actinomycetota bacterium]